jgi:2-hydroxy-3-keto-5-methylthiopentenyl-1-phosphate phosphatase
VSEVVGFDRTIGFTIASCSYKGTQMEKEQTMQQMMQQLLANQQMAEANVKAIQERMAANRKSNREELKGMMNAIQERMDTNLKDLKEDVK